MADNVMPFPVLRPAKAETKPRLRPNGRKQAISYMVRNLGQLIPADIPFEVGESKPVPGYPPPDDVA